MKRLILHIGMHKTASTALQTALHRKLGLLKQLDINYPYASANHSMPFFRMFHDDPLSYPHSIVAGIDTLEKAEANRNFLKANWGNYLQNLTESTTIISGEGLTRTPLINLNEMHEFLRRYFDKITVIAYCRPPYSSIQSLFPQWSKTKPLAEIFNAPPIPRYQASLDPYLKEFGEENIILRPFVESLLVKNSIFHDFVAHTLGIEKLADQLPDIQENIAFNWPMMLIADSVNRHYPLICNGKLNPERDPEILKHIPRMEGWKFRLHQSVIEKHQEEISAHVTWINKRLGIDLRDYDIKPDTDEPIIFQIPILPTGQKRVDDIAHKLNATHLETFLKQQKNS